MQGFPHECNVFSSAGNASPLILPVRKVTQKLRELTSIVDELKGAFDLQKGGGYLPFRCQGTRWVTHKLNAMQRVVERYGAYILQLTALINDSSVKAADKVRLKGYFKIWKAPKMLISCAIFFDALKPLSILSLVLQGNEVDIVMSIESTLNSLKALMLLLEKEPCQWPTVKLIKTRIKDIDGVMEYQGIPVGNFDECVQQCSIHVNADLHRVEENIKDWLEWSDLKLLRSILIFLETQNWI